MLPTDVDENAEKLMKLGSLKIELDLVACKPDALNKAGLHRQKKKGALNRGYVQAQGMATSQILELHSRYIYYQEPCKVPGLCIHRGCTMSSVSWIPIASSLEPER